ncbi:rab-GTPase-TBC domain-containing protein [Phyllosticta citribraziliensis]|uniref:Rab-GTPase-TBC domain-containing protein n=1 Tax=Phyllosticta citribraziliensis TaxID=989973 RepID=A0ABR1M3Q2_9PEZI
MTNLAMFLLNGPPDGNIQQGLKDLRFHILDCGIPANARDGMSELRIYIWLILLNAEPVRTEMYLDLVRNGASPAYTKIKNDTFRTLATDPLFRNQVREFSLIRVLNAVAWKLLDAHEARVNGWQSPPTLSDDQPFRSRSSLTGTTATEGSQSQAGDHAEAEQDGYVQGMNVLAAPFLYCAHSEAEAFVAFHKFITAECPGYVRGSMEGVHKGLALVDTVLNIVDPKLSMYLSSKGLNAEIYAFASLLTMSACTPPLPEVLQLWDFLFAYGSHLNILCIVAQLVIIRDQILASPSPNQILRSLPPLQAKKIISLVVANASKVPDDVYQQMIDHAK